MKRILFVLSSASAVSIRDGIEAALAALAFDHPLSVLVEGDAVGWLQPGQPADRRGLPDVARGLAALLHHGADTVVARSASLRERGMGETAVAVRALEGSELSSWIAEHSHVFRF